VELFTKEIENPEKYIQHISLLGWDHITLTGDYIWVLKLKSVFFRG